VLAVGIVAMATDKAAIATGAEVGDGLRKRPVGGPQDIGAPSKIEIDDKKPGKKVPISTTTLEDSIANRHEAKVHLADSQ